MRTINYSRLPKGLTRHIGLNVFVGRKYVYILSRAAYTGQEDRLWVITPERYNRYQDITMGNQLNDRDIKEIAEEAHRSIESVRVEVSVLAADKYIEYNEPDATSLNV